MAIANFFDRASTAAAQLMQAKYDQAEFERRVTGCVACLAWDREALAGDGAVTIELLVRLMSRLFPSLCLVALDDDARSAMETLTALARSINPLIGIVDDAAGSTIVVVVGSTPVGWKLPTFYVGSDGWTIALDRRTPVRRSSSSSPVAAGAVACVAAANVFRHAFCDLLENADLDGDTRQSLLGPACSPSDAFPEEIDLGTVHLIGAGAIGQAALWTLARWPGLRGIVNVVDHEHLELSNLQRYVLATQADVGVAKSELARIALEGTGLSALPHASTWQDYAARIPDHKFEIVATALDTAADRISVQGALPHWIVNGWTQAGDLGVSRHRFGEGPCLACLYIPKGKTKDQYELVAEAIGMPEAAIEVRTMLQVGLPLDAPFLTRVERALELAQGELMPFVGQTLEVFHRKAICGGAILKLRGEGARNRETMVPMPFQSAFAGIMLAAEIVRQAARVAVPDMPSSSDRLPFSQAFAALGCRSATATVVLGTGVGWSSSSTSWVSRRLSRGPRRTAGNWTS